MKPNPQAPPDVIFRHPDSTGTAFICEREQESLLRRFNDLLRAYDAVELPELRHDEMGVSFLTHQIGPHRLQSWWMYDEFFIRGPGKLVKQIVSELRRFNAEPGAAPDPAA